MTSETKSQSVCSGLISWTMSARQISTLIHDRKNGNDRGGPPSIRVAIGNHFFVAVGLEVLEERSKSAPGTINKIGKDFLQISSFDHDIIVRNFHHLNGRAVSMGDLVSSFRLREGHRLDQPDSGIVKRIEELGSVDILVNRRIQLSI